MELNYVRRNKKKQDQIAKPSDYPQGWFKPKPCRCCDKLFEPRAPCELYCSDRCKDRKAQSHYFKRNYKITVDDYEAMYHHQQGLCKICNQEGWVMNKDRHHMKLVVDHCHITGKVRGLLCHNCNRGLGLFQDNEELLTNAAEYLKVQRLSKASDESK